MKKNPIVSVILMAWITIWIIFLVRPYFKKSLLDRYITLMKLSTEEKRSYVTGDELYSFIGFCKESVKEPSTYQVEGLEKDSIEHRRFKYYMYPNLESNDSKYIFVYKKRDFTRVGYRVFGSVSPEAYILARVD